MSTGPGIIQRAIISAIDDGGLYPLPWIADRAGYDLSKLAVRQSFARAANTLYTNGAVKLWDARWPSKVLVVAKADEEPTDADWALAKLRHVETLDYHAGYEVRWEAGAASLSGDATPVQELIVKDTARINRAS